SLNEGEASAGVARPAASALALDGATEARRACGATISFVTTPASTITSARGTARPARTRQSGRRFSASSMSACVAISELRAHHQRIFTAHGCRVIRRPPRDRCEAFGKIELHCAAVGQAHFEEALRRA